MIFSQQLMFSDQQAITATAPSTNVIDLGATSAPPGDAAALTRDIGIGDTVPLLIQITEAFDNLTSLDIALQVDDNSGFASAKEVWSQTILLADLVAGARPNIQGIPPGVDERYARLNYTVAGTAPTVGKITAGVNMGVQNDY